MNDDGPIDFDEPCPPHPAASLEKVGLFFWYFSVVEEWSRDYLLACEDCTHDAILKMGFSGLIERWQAAAIEKERADDRIVAMRHCLKELADNRNAVAHAVWQLHDEQLYGRSRADITKGLLL